MAKFKLAGKVKALVCLGIFMVLESCALSAPVIDMAKTPEPVLFECRDGVQFSIVFDKKTDTANLTFTGHSTPKLLENKKLASGIEYSNDDYAFREHRGVTKLIDLTEDDGVETICRRVKRK